MNLSEIDSSGSSDQDSETEVVPLDFRTALVTEGNKIMIQAKPLHFKTVEEDLLDLELAEERKKKGLSAEDDFFQKITRVPFQPSDKDVVLIDPGINTDEIFGDVELPCNLEPKLNNAVTAPKSARQRQVASPKLESTSRQEQKSLQQAERLFKARPQTATNRPLKSVFKQMKKPEDEDNTPATEVNKDMLQFDTILNKMGMTEDAMLNLVEFSDDEEDELD